MVNYDGNQGQVRNNLYRRATHNCSTCQRPQVNFKGVDFCTVIDHNHSARSYRTASSSWILPNECLKCKCRSYDRKFVKGDETRKCKQCGTQWSWRLKDQVNKLLSVQKSTRGVNNTAAMVVKSKPPTTPVPKPPRVGMAKCCPQCGSKAFRIYSGKTTYALECFNKHCEMVTELLLPKTIGVKTTTIVPAKVAEGLPAITIIKKAPTNQKLVVSKTPQLEPKASQSGEKRKPEAKPVKTQGPAITPRSEPSNTFKGNSRLLDDQEVKVIPGSRKSVPEANARVVERVVEVLSPGSEKKLRKEVSVLFQNAPMATNEDFHWLRTLLPSSITIVTDKRQARVRVPRLTQLNQIKFVVLAAISTGKLEKLDPVRLASMIMSHRLEMSLIKKEKQRGWSVVKRAQK